MIMKFVCNLSKKLIQKVLTNPERNNEMKTPQVINYYIPSHFPTKYGNTQSWIGHLPRSLLQNKQLSIDTMGSIMLCPGLKT